MTLGGRRFLLSLAIVAASVCLALGVSLPIIKLTKFVFFTYEHSLISTVQCADPLRPDCSSASRCWSSRSCCPILKLLYLLLLSTLPQTRVCAACRASLRALEWLGKWSMHDVLVLSLSIFFIKSQGVYDAKSLNGVYFFTAAVLLMILAYAWLRSDVTAADTPAARAGQSPRRRPRPCATSPSASLSSSRPCSSRSASCCPPSASPRSTCGPTSTPSRPSSGRSTRTRNSSSASCIFMFSILFPFLKLFYLLTLVTSPDMPPEFRDKSISAMEWLGRYSMTDVMVLALMIFYINASGYTEASVLPGVYFFAASALMTMFAYGWANSINPGIRRPATPACRPGWPASRPPAASANPAMSGPFLSHVQPVTGAVYPQRRGNHIDTSYVGAVGSAWAHYALRPAVPPLARCERTLNMSPRRHSLLCAAAGSFAVGAAERPASAAAAPKRRALSLSDPALAAAAPGPRGGGRDPGQPAKTATRPNCPRPPPVRSRPRPQRRPEPAQDQPPRAEPPKTAARQEPAKAAAREPAETSARAEADDGMAQLKRMVDSADRTWVGRAATAAAVCRQAPACSPTVRYVRSSAAANWDWR